MTSRESFFFEQRYIWLKKNGKIRGLRNVLIISDIV